MNEIKVNLVNLNEQERQQLLALINKANRTTVKLSDIKVGETFKIGDITFIKMSENDGVTNVVTKDIVFKSVFGKDNNFKNSTVFDKLNNEFLPKIAEIVGFENIENVTTDLTTLDGIKGYGNMTSKITLPTLDYYRKNADIFRKYNLNCWWWLATAWSDKENSSCVLCVSPSGYFDYGNYSNLSGVRPFLRFVSSISVSRED